MARQIIVTMRMNDAEKSDLERTAEILGVPMSKAIRGAVSAMTERVTANTPRAEFAPILESPEWQESYVWRIIAGDISYEKALRECGRAVAARMKADAEEAARQFEEAAEWAATWEA